MSGWDAATGSYSGLRALEHVIDEIVPAVDTIPDSILASHISEALETVDIETLAGHCGPKSGKTLGTALVHHRAHRLNERALAVDPTGSYVALGLPSKSTRSQLYRLWQRGMRLDVPDQHGQSPLMQALTWAMQSLAATGTGAMLRVFLGSVQVNAEGQQALWAGAEPAYDPLQVDPDGRHLLQAPMLQEHIDWMVERLEFALQCRGTPAAQLAALEPLGQGALWPAWRAWWEPRYAQALAAVMDATPPTATPATKVRL